MTRYSRPAPIGYVRFGNGAWPSADYCTVCPLPPGTLPIERVAGRPIRCSVCGTRIINHADSEVTRWP